MSIARASDGVILEANPAFLRASGFTREEVIGRSTLDLDLWLHPAQRAEFFQRIQREGLIRDLEGDFRSKSGRIRSLIVNADVLELGAVPCILTVGIDITERRRQERMQAATYQIAQVVLAGAELRALFTEVHRIIGELMPARNFYVALLNPERSLLTFPYFVDETMCAPADRPPRNGITEFVLDTGEPLLAVERDIIATLRARGSYAPTGCPCAQWMGAPLKIEGRSIGVIALQDYNNPAAYTEEDKRLLMFVADQTAAAIHRQHVETARRDAQKVQAATFAISQAVLAGGDLAALFAELHRIVGGLISAKNFYVALLSPDRSLLSFPYFVDETAPTPAPRKPGFGLTEYVINTAKPLRTTADELTVILRGDSRYKPTGKPSALWLGAPLVIEGRAIGVITVQDYHNPNAYTEADLQLLNFVAGQAAAAVHRRQAEARLARAEKRYRSIFENAVEGLYVTTPDGRFLSANPALARMLGYESPAALLAAVDINRQIYVQKNRRDDFFALIEKSDEVTDFDSEVCRRDGTTFWISESVRVVRNAQGEIDHFEGVATDITQQREAAQALQAAKEAADAASRAKSYFLASVSHELRTPLNGILGYTQILRRDSTLGPRQREGIRVIHESADHLLALINDVLDLSKIEAGRVELHLGDFELPQFADGVASVFAPRAKEKCILFETAVAADLPRWVRGDEQRLRQIVFNLVSNAVKFTKAGGAVFSVQRVAGGDAGETIRFSVSDTGPGISDDDQKKLFEPFSQVGNHGGAAACGTGLGLAISRSLVERMGGKLRVESKPGWGSRFWFDVTLPVAAAALPSAATTSRRIVGYEGPRRRVLIVDDNAANRAVMVDMLAPLGFTLADAADGAIALEVAENFAPDLVLMDLRLPGSIDGLEATRRLRQSARGHALKIVAVSASAYDFDRSECLAAGCDEFLAKPFREEELWAATARTLGLTWRLADGEETRTPFALAVHPPPTAEAAAIYELAAKGDVVGIRTRAQALITLDARYAPFAQSVLDLAARFKMKAIRQYVARYAS